MFLISIISKLSVMFLISIISKLSVMFLISIISKLFDIHNVLLLSYGNNCFANYPSLKIPSLKIPSLKIPKNYKNNLHTLQEIFLFFHEIKVTCKSFFFLFQVCAEYEFKVFVSDDFEGGINRETTLDVYLYILDENDNKPIFINTPYISHVLEVLFFR